MNDINKMPKPPFLVRVSESIHRHRAKVNVAIKRAWYWVLRVEPPPPSRFPYSHSAGNVHNFFALKRAWKRDLESEKPWRYFIIIRIPVWWQDVIRWLVYKRANITDYIENRFVLKTHIKSTGAKLGEDLDFHEALMHINFGYIVDLVEKTFAVNFVHHHREQELISLGYDVDKLLKEIDRAPWKQQVYRNKDIGLAYLHKLIKDCRPEVEAEWDYETSQFHIETLVLYIWWTKIRPLRKEPMVLSGEEELREHLIVVYGERLYQTLPQKYTDMLRDKDMETDSFFIQHQTEDSEMFLRCAAHLNRLFNQEH
jgi:hypothetical protein